MIIIFGKLWNQKPTCHFFLIEKKSNKSNAAKTIVLFLFARNTILREGVWHWIEMREMRGPLKTNLIYSIELSQYSEMEEEGTNKNFGGCESLI